MNFSLLFFSNHGGRQVDTAVPAIECLESIINVVDGRAEGRTDLITIFSNMVSSLKSFSKRNLESHSLFSSHGIRKQYLSYRKLI